jgi:adenylylsulfate kinase/chloramphenicol 3-O phosphotransferase
MEKGKIIFLNGVLRARERRSIVEAMQARKDRVFVCRRERPVSGDVGETYLRENYWKYLSDAIVMMYYTARMFSDHGKDILIDGIIVERPEIAPHYQKIKEIFRGYPLSVVEVYCPLEICRQRNIARGDRYETQSEEQAAIMARDIDYLCRVDTGAHSPEECADEIMRCVFG